MGVVTNRIKDRNCGLQNPVPMVTSAWRKRRRRSKRMRGRLGIGNMWKVRRDDRVDYRE